jgi:hypothetical protein
MESTPLQLSLKAWRIFPQAYDTRFEAGPIVIGANDLGVWIDRPESLPSPTKRKRV